MFGDVTEWIITFWIWGLLCSWEEAQGTWRVSHWSAPWSPFSEIMLTKMSWRENIVGHIVGDKHPTIFLFLPGLEREDETRVEELGAVGLPVRQHCCSYPATSFCCSRISTHWILLEASGLNLNSHFFFYRVAFDLTCICKIKHVYSVEVQL